MMVHVQCDMPVESLSPLCSAHEKILLLGSSWTTPNFFIFFQIMFFCYYCMSKISFSSVRGHCKSPLQVFSEVAGSFNLPFRVLADLNAIGLK